MVKSNPSTPHSRAEGWWHWGQKKAILEFDMTEGKPHHNQRGRYVARVRGYTNRIAESLQQGGRTKQSGYLFDSPDDELFGVWKRQKSPNDNVPLLEYLGHYTQKIVTSIRRRVTTDMQKLRQDRSNDGTPSNLAARMALPQQQRTARHAPLAPKKAPPRSNFSPWAFAVRRFSARVALLARQNTKVTAGLSICALLLLLSGVRILQQRTATSPASGAGVGTGAEQAVLGKEVAKPSFAVMAPTNVSDDAVRYDEARKVASYNDTIDGVNITVSQQQLPDSFKADPSGAVKNMAAQFNAKQEIAAGEQLAYLGTSIKGPQTLIMQRQGMLLFIKSERAISDDAWKAYISKIAE